jgi:hypothetical protein
MMQVKRSILAIPPGAIGPLGMTFGDLYFPEMIGKNRAPTFFLWEGFLHLLVSTDRIPPFFP